jgi:hypothetical protein
MVEFNQMHKVWIYFFVFAALYLQFMCETSSKV